MTDINQVVVVGRLTRAAELKYTQSGAPVVNASIASNWRRKQGEQWVDEVNFFDVTLWGKLGESIAKYMTKGRQIAVAGELRQERWDQDGQTRSKVKIIASNVELLAAPKGESAPSSVASPSTSTAPAVDDFVDDIPF